MYTATILLFLLVFTHTLLSFYRGHLPSQQYCQYSGQQQSPTLDRDNNHSYQCSRCRQYWGMTTAWTVNLPNLMPSRWLYILVWEGGVKTKWLHCHLAKMAKSLAGSVEATTNSSTLSWDALWAWLAWSVCLQYICMRASVLWAQN